jgi:hypothetical protein
VDPLGAIFRHPALAMFHGPILRPWKVGKALYVIGVKDAAGHLLVFDGQLDETIDLVIAALRRIDGTRRDTP